MLSLPNVSSALRHYRGRYEYLDVFADDVAELASDAWPQALTVTGDGQAAIDVSGIRLFVRLFPEKGIARFRLADQLSSVVSKAAESSSGGAPAISPDAIETARSNASQLKEGLLGGLIVGMLVGTAAGAEAQPVERVLALEFDSERDTWRAYDGPYLRWAKRALQPAVVPAA